VHTRNNENDCCQKCKTTSNCTHYTFNSEKKCRLYKKTS
jgi:hypothetical protein